MANCIICGEEIIAESDSISRNSEAGPVRAHKSCVVKLKSILGGVQEESRTLVGKRGHGYLEKVNDNWILARRDISLGTMILAFLDVQDSPCDVKEVYDWLRRNEVRSSNPAEYVKKLRNRGYISVLNVDKSRLLRITEAGRSRLSSSGRETSEPKSQ